MALELQISEGSYSRSNHTVTLTDDTGNYNVTTNHGGYGTPNTERNELALVVSSVRINSQVEVVKWDDPINDSSFDYFFNSDGVYNIYLCALPFEAGAFDPNLLATDLVFYSTLDDAVYKVIENGDGSKSVEETNDVVSNSSFVSSALKYKVQSYAETKRISIFCEDIGSCDGFLSTEYKDLTKSIEVAECLFLDTFYLQSDNTLLYINKIDKQR